MRCSADAEHPAVFATTNAECCANNSERGNVMQITGFEKNLLVMIVTPQKSLVMMPFLTLTESNFSMFSANSNSDKLGIFETIGVCVARNAAFCAPNFISYSAARCWDCAKFSLGSMNILISSFVFR
jgi:hypothetical protein